MLNANDPSTVVSLRRLTRIVQENRKPLVFWIGAGASGWLGYPSWQDTALSVRAEFFRYAQGFDNKSATRLIDDGRYPEFFELAKTIDSGLYHRILVQQFSPKPDTDLYSRFLDLLHCITPNFVVTTNVDEALEARMNGSVLIQNTDVSRVVESTQAKQAFIAKLHGSISNVESTVFTRTDYERLLNKASFRSTIKYLFSSCSVVFLGYGVQDEYVLNLLASHATETELFGSGPHFIVSNNTPPFISGLNRIAYNIQHYPDHRAALTVLDFIRQVPRTDVQLTVVSDPASTRIVEPEPGSVPAGKSAYFISDLLPPGTYQTSQTLIATGNDGRELEVTVGLGFTNEELPPPYATSTALHDLVVGLVCFDFVYLPITAIPAAHDTFGSDCFWQLVNEDTLRFIDKQEEPSVVRTRDEALGFISSVTLQSPDCTGPRSVSEMIRRFIKPAPGKEQIAGKLLDGLEEKTIIFSGVGEDIPALTRSSILMPSVSTLLGIGEAIVPTSVPHWLKFGYLRLAHLVQANLICSRLGIQATKLPFGGTTLTSAAFGVDEGPENADQVASYVVSGRFNTDLSEILKLGNNWVQRIYKFRNSGQGESLRTTIRNLLAREPGSEFTSAVNAGLTNSIPTGVLQRARDKMSTLMTESAFKTNVPAVWSSSTRTDIITRHWRERSRRLLLDLCNARHIGKDDRCICGSGQKLRLCCLSPLHG